MDKQIRNEEYRIVLILTYVQDSCRPILSDDDTVQGKRQSDVKIFLDTAVVMCVEIGKSAILVQRILLDIESRGVDMSAEDIHSALHRLMAYFH